MAKFKMTAKQVHELIKQLGVDVEIVADDQADAAFKLEDAITDVDNSRTPILKPTLEAAIKADLTKQLAGKHGGDLRAHLRRLSNNVLKTSDLEGLKDEEALQKFLDTVLGQKDSSLDDIRRQMTEKLAEAEQEKARLLGDKDKEIANLRFEYNEREIDALLEAALSEVPRTGGDIKTQAGLAKTFLRTKFKDHFDETKRTIELRDLANPERPALAGNVQVQLKDVMTDFAKGMGILKTDNRTENPNEHMNMSKQTHSAPGYTTANQDLDALGSAIMNQ